MKNLDKKVFDFVKRDNYKIKDIPHLNSLIDTNYTIKNDKQLKYTFYNLLSLKDNTNNYIMDIGKYFQYLKKVDNKLVVSDDACKFLIQKDYQKVLKDYSKMKFLEYLNENKLSLFITFTNPSKFHYYKHNRKGNIVKNQKCKSLTLGETIEKSFININLIKREFYKLVKKYLKRRKIDSDFDFISNLIH